MSDRANFESLLIVMSNDFLARKQLAAMEAKSRDERALRVAAGAPASIRDDLAERVLDAKAVCAEFGALGSEC